MDRQVNIDSGQTKQQAWLDTVQADQKTDLGEQQFGPKEAGGLDSHKPKTSCSDT